MPKVLIALVLLLSGCATMVGVEPMTEEERVECAETKTCQVWTRAQLQYLIQRAFHEGAKYGTKSGI